MGDTTGLAQQQQPDPAPQGIWWWLPLPRPAESLTSSLADSNSWRASDSASANSACNSRGTRLRAAAGRTWQAAVLAGFGLQCSAKLTTVLTLVQAAKLTHQLLHRRPTAAYHDLTGQRWCCCSSRTAHWNWRCLMSSRPHLHCFCNLLQLLFLCICSVNQFCPLTASSPGDTHKCHRHNTTADIANDEDITGVFQSCSCCAGEQFQAPAWMAGSLPSCPAVGTTTSVSHCSSCCF
jgi:hypothetical protein